MFVVIFVKQENNVTTKERWMVRIKIVKWHLELIGWVQARTEGVMGYCPPLEWKIYLTSLNKAKNAPKSIFLSVETWLSVVSAKITVYTTLTSRIVYTSPDKASAKLRQLTTSPCIVSSLPTYNHSRCIVLCILISDDNYELRIKTVTNKS